MTALPEPHLDDEALTEVLDEALAVRAVSGAVLEIEACLMERLPLLDLARMIGERYGCLRVVARPLPEGYIGCASFNDDLAVIVLSSELDCGVHLADTFAHELAHLLDPAFVRGDAVDLEPFADLLGSLLLATTARRDPSACRDLGDCVCAVIARLGKVSM